MKEIFIAFTGPEIKQNKVFSTAPNYECWNLNKFTLNEFIMDIKKVIPPINRNVLGNYIRDEDDKDIMAITEKEIRNCSWGLLLPDNVPDSIVNSYAEIIFLLNLYSSRFLRPVFFVTNIGITRNQYKNDQNIYFLNQNQSEIFKRKKFVKFYERLIPQSVYGNWQRDRCKKWDKEDWRLFVASLLYSQLKDYENMKKAIIWQREAADMATILECLFTAEDFTNEEIGYRLRKRIAALIGFKFENIEHDIKKLYKERSKFVHGVFFNEVGKEAKKEDSVVALPLPDFKFLYKHKEYVRFALMAYLNLAIFLKDPKIQKKFKIKRPLDLIENSIINLDSRKMVESQTRQLFSLLPNNINSNNRDFTNKLQSVNI